MLPLLMLCGTTLITGILQAAVPVESLRRFSLELGDYRGISDLTRDANGVFWAIPERQRALLRLRLVGDRPGLEATPVPVRGVSSDVDFESLTSLADGRFLAGTETQRSQRRFDLIDICASTRAWPTLPTSSACPTGPGTTCGPTPTTASRACAPWARASLRRSKAPRSAAPPSATLLWGRYDLDKKAWETFGIELTTRIGKVSAIS